MADVPGLVSSSSSSSECSESGDEDAGLKNLVDDANKLNSLRPPDKRFESAVQNSDDDDAQSVVSLPDLVSDSCNEEEEDNVERLPLQEMGLPSSCSDTANLQEKESEASSIKKANLPTKDGIWEATNAFLGHQYQKAMSLYEKAIKEAENNDDEQMILLKYAYGCACLEKGSHETLTRGIEVFEEILETHGSIEFPLAYYGLGRIYCKYNRYKKALEMIKMGLDVLALQSPVCAYQWPESSVYIEESKPEKIEAMLKEIEELCQNPPRPDAVCRYNNCDNPFKTEIYFTDPDCKGFLRIKCKEYCCLHYHLNCWKTLKDESLKSNDKEFLGCSCLTPDCSSFVTEIVHINSKGDVVKQFKHNVKSEIPAKFKSKKPRLEKKKGKKKCKKQVETIASQPKENCQKETDANQDVSNEVISVAKLKEVDKPHRTVSSPSFKSCKPASSVDPTKIDLEKVLILKKQDDDEPSWSVCQKSDRHREKKREKKKLAKMVTVQEFLGERALGPEALYNEFVQRTNTCKAQYDLTDIQHDSTGYEPFPPDDASFLQTDSIKHSIWMSLSRFVVINGPVHIHDPKLLHEIAKMDPSLQEIILLSGGIKDFIMESNLLVVINDIIYLMQEVDVAVNQPQLYSRDFPTEKETKPGNPTASWGSNTLEALDSIELTSDVDECLTSTLPTAAVRMDERLANEFVENEAHEDNVTVENSSHRLQEPVAESIHSVSSSESSSPTENKETTVYQVKEHVQSSNMPSSSSSSRVSEKGNKAEKLLAALSSSNNKPYLPPQSGGVPKSKNCFKYISYFKKLFRFIPSFSEVTQKRLLCWMLKTMTSEKVLRRYQQEHDVNLDVESFEKSFNTVAGALSTAVDCGTQTESDETFMKKIKTLEESNASLQIQLNHCIMTMTNMRQSEVEFQANQARWMHEFNALKMCLKVSEDKCEATLKKNGDLKARNEQLQQELLNMENKKWEVKQEAEKVTLQARIHSNGSKKSMVIPGTQNQQDGFNVVNDATRVVVVENKEDEDQDDDDDNWFTVSHTKGAVQKSLVGKLPPSAVNQNQPLQVIPPRNCFENVMSRLQMKFSHYSRAQLGDFVRQLRSNRSNSLTGLTINAIVTEVSKLISETERQGESGIKAKVMRSASNPTTAVTGNAMGLDKITDSENPWRTTHNKMKPWNYDDQDCVNVCVICTDEMVENVIALQCHHSFHKDCIRDWLRRQSTCPTCRVHCLLPDEFPSLI